MEIDNQKEVLEAHILNTPVIILKLLALCIPSPDTVGCKFAWHNLRLILRAIRLRVQTPSISATLSLKNTLGWTLALALSTLSWAPAKLHKSPVVAKNIHLSFLAIFIYLLVFTQNHVDIAMIKDSSLTSSYTTLH